MTQMLAPQQKVDNVRSLLNKLKPQIQLALPKHMTPDRMARVAMTCILRTPKLLDCDPTSLAGAIITCSQLGLEPDPVLGHVHLVPFRNRRRGTTEVVVIPGYKGLMKLARNSGEVATIDAHAVYSRDVFKYAYGLKPLLHHVPYQGTDKPGEPTHYYAVAIMKGGAGQFIVMTKAQVEAHRDRFAKNGGDADSPWQTDFDAMGKKTCIRDLAKYLPASVELQRAAALDEQTEAGIPQDLGATIDLTGIATEVTDDKPTNGVANGAPASKLDALAAKLATDRAPQAAGSHGEQPSLNREPAIGDTQAPPPAAPAPEQTQAGPAETALMQEDEPEGPKPVEEMNRVELNAEANGHWGRLKMKPADVLGDCNTYLGERSKAIMQTVDELKLRVLVEALRERK